MLGIFILSIPFFVQTLQKLLRDKFGKKKELGGTDVKLGKMKELGGTDVNIWCELDSNLLGEIIGRLCLTDQARFRTVCKNWLAAHPVTPTKSLPWCICFVRVGPTVSERGQFRLYEPLSRPYLVSVHNISLAKLGIPTPSTHKDKSVSFMHNWLFFTFATTTLFCRRRRYFILYSVFTKKIIILPKLDYPNRLGFRSMHTTKPDSPNCVFFLLDTISAGKIVVITYHNGDKEWTAREFDRVVEFLPCSCHPVYIRGIMYIVSPYGQLASYNIVDGEFKFESLSVDELFRLNYRSSKKSRVFELNGELMLIYFGSRKINNTNSLSKPCIKMYDWSNKVWIPVSTLGGNALFVSDNFFQVTTINREEMSINGVLSNKIYRFFDYGCLIYSIQDGELVEFKFTNSNLLEDGGGNLPEYKYNRDVSFPYGTRSIFWLNPPPPPRARPLLKQSR